MIILGERASLTKQANFTYRSWQPTTRLVTPNPFLRFEESAFSFDHPSRKPRIIFLGTDCTQFELEPTLTALSCWPTKLQRWLVASPLAKVRTTQQLRTSMSSALSALTSCTDTVLDLCQSWAYERSLHLQSERIPQRIAGGDRR